MNKEPYFLREAPAEPNEWESLANYTKEQNMNDVVAQNLSQEAKEKLETKIAEIDDTENKDYANEYAINRKHTHEEYDRFRQEATDTAISEEISKLSAKQIANLRDLLAEIDEAENKDYANGYAINHKHTHEEYDRFRQEAINNAIKNSESADDDTKVDNQINTNQKNEHPADNNQATNTPIDNVEASNHNDDPGNPDSLSDNERFDAKEVVGQEILDNLNSPEAIEAIMEQENQQDINAENEVDIAHENDQDIANGEENGETIQKGNETAGETAETRKGRIGEKLSQVRNELSNRDIDPNERKDKVDAKRQAVKEMLEKFKGEDIDLSDIVSEVDAIVDEDKAERLKEVGEKLDEVQAKIAELYARNRRLIVGAKNRAEFRRAKGEYEDLLNEYLKLRAEATHSHGMKSIMDRIKARIDEANDTIEKDLRHFAQEEAPESEDSAKAIRERREKLVEEALKAIKDEYNGATDKLETDINAQCIQDVIEEEARLEDATIEQLDNGTICRRIVNKVINNKFLKGALIAAGAVGLAVTGVGVVGGIAAGTMSLGFGLTAGGAALGAARGATVGTIMSRQNSANSAVRGFATEEEIKKQVEGIDILNQDEDTKNVAGWLLDEFEDANRADLSSNRKRTLISAGVGAAVGALMSGVQINNVNTEEVSELVPAGNEPASYEPTYFDNVNIAPGHGAYDTFTQMGGDPSKFQQALDIMHSIDAKYGLVPGSNGETVGFNGQVGDFAHTYPGSIDSWPDVAREYIREVAEEWAKQGLIPGTETGGGPIYDTVTRTVTKLIPNAFYNYLTQASAISATGGLIGVANSGPNRGN